LENPIVNGIINDVWLALPSWFPAIGLDEFVVMPNHVHFIIWITNLTVGPSLAGIRNVNKMDEGKPRLYKIPKPQKINLAPALGDVVGAFKSLVFKVYLDWIETNDPSRRAIFWQGNYYEHIIRNERELNAIRKYIMDNPVNWETDRDNIKNLRQLPPPKKVEEYLIDIEELIWQMDQK
jgi:REP element-mobilizing transposase RayT